MESVLVPYLVFTVLAVEGVLLSLLLLPLPPALAGPATQLLKRINVYALTAFVVLVAFLTLGTPHFHFC